MIKAAREKSDGVILLLNSDEWLIRKKGKNCLADTNNQGGEHTDVRCGDGKAQFSQCFFGQEFACQTRQGKHDQAQRTECGANNTENENHLGDDFYHLENR